ncbi:MAG: hypothetical protein U0103_23130 [Candidatus Obscuribacterales bacterium]
MNDVKLFVTEREAAHLCGVSRSWLQKRRTNDSGPPYVQVGGGIVRYELSELKRWFSEHTHSANQGD